MKSFIGTIKQLNNQKVKWLNLLLLFTIHYSLFTVSMCVVFPATPSGINYQGLLRKNNISYTGTSAIEFKIYDALSGGNLLWTSGVKTIPITKGNFSYILGQDNPSQFSVIDWEGKTCYLEITVDGTTMTPREKFTSSAYAINALKVGGKSLTELDERYNSRYLSLSGGTSTGSLNFPGGTLTGTLNLPGSSIWNASGNVGIGTTTPVQKLDVAGTVQMTGFKMPLGASNGYVLTSNADGVGVWAAAGGGGFPAGAYISSAPTTSQTIQPSVFGVRPLRIKGYPCDSATNVLEVYDAAVTPSLAWSFDAAGNLVPSANRKIDTTANPLKISGGGPDSIWIEEGAFQDGKITGADLKDRTITCDKIANSSIGSYEIVNSTITVEDIADNAITSAKILNGEIIDADISAIADILPTKIRVSTVAAVTETLELWAYPGTNMINGAKVQGTTVPGIHQSSHLKGAGDAIVDLSYDQIKYLAIVSTPNFTQTIKPTANVNVLALKNSAGAGDSLELLSFYDGLDNKKSYFTAGGQLYLTTDDAIKMVGNAKIYGENIKYATTDSTGTVRLATSADTAAGLVVQANDTRLASGAGYIKKSPGNETQTIQPSYNKIPLIITGTIGNTTDVFQIGDNSQSIAWRFNTDGDLVSAGTRNISVSGVMVSSKVVVNSTASDALVVTGGIIAGTDDVQIVSATGKISGNLIGTYQIVNSTITVEDLASDSVTSAKILDGTITKNDIAEGAVGSYQIIDSTITTDDIKDGTILNADIKLELLQSNKIDGDKIKYATTDTTGTVRLAMLNTGVDAGTVIQASDTRIGAAADAIRKSPTGNQTITAPALSGVVPLAIKGNPTASTDILQIYDSAASPELAWKFDKDGNLIRVKAGVTVDGVNVSDAFVKSPTGNQTVIYAVASAQTILQMHSSQSAAPFKITDSEDTTKFSIDKLGGIYSNNVSTFTAGINLNSNAQIKWNGESTTNLKRMDNGKIGTDGKFEANTFYKGGILLDMVYVTTSTDQNIEGLKTIKNNPTGTAYDSAAFLIEPKTNQTTGALFGIGTGGTTLETEEKFVITPSSVAIRNADLRFKGSSGSKIQLLGDNKGLIYFGDDENNGISKQAGEDWIKIGTDLNVVGNYRKNGALFEMVYLTTNTNQDISGRKTIVTTPLTGSAFSNAAFVINAPATTPDDSNLLGVGLNSSPRFRVATSSIIISNADLQFTTTGKKIWFGETGLIADTNLYRHTDGSKLVTDGSLQAKGDSNEFGVIISSVVTNDDVSLNKNKKIYFDRDDGNNSYVGYDSGNSCISFIVNGVEVAKMRP